jgi:mycothiol synthase
MGPARRGPSSCWGQMIELPEGLALTQRRPTVDDAPAIAELIKAADLADSGSFDTTTNDVIEELGSVDLETDAWLVHAPDGGLVAAAWIEGSGAGVSWRTSLVVHPEWRRRGIGNSLARKVEKRAREHIREAPEGTRVSLYGWVMGGSPPVVLWARHLGFDVIRRALKMRIDMTEPPPTPQVPPGVSVRSFRPGLDDRSTFDAVEEAFSDSWGHLPMDYDDFLRQTVAPAFDPSLWIVAVHRDEIVGTSLCATTPEGGWVRSLGVRRKWRNRGLGAALLLHSFGVFWGRGMPVVALGVDQESLTGATRLYEKAGMRVVEHFERVSKILREGVDTAVRVIAR